MSTGEAATTKDFIREIINEDLLQAAFVEAVIRQTVAA